MKYNLKIQSIKYILYFLNKKIKRTIKNKLTFFLNFYYPNYKLIKKTKITISNRSPICYQFTKITGSGNVRIGDNCVFGFKLGGHWRGGAIEIQPRSSSATIIFGNNVHTNNNLFVCALNIIKIGSDTLIGEHVTILDHEAHGTSAKNRRSVGEIGDVIIGENVWIGNNVLILKNTEIGENCIVAAGAVVSGKYPPNVIIGGIPAKIIRKI